MRLQVRAAVRAYADAPGDQLAPELTGRAGDMHQPPGPAMAAGGQGGTAAAVPPGLYQELPRLAGTELLRSVSALRARRGALLVFPGRSLVLEEVELPEGAAVIVGVEDLAAVQCLLADP